MNKLAITVFAASLIGGAIFISPANAVSLKENAIISGSNITLGDIFYDLPRDTDKVLGPAPRPGADMVLNARTLMRIAVAMDLPWRPNSADEQITLKRAATIISKDEIAARLKRAITESGQTDDFEIDFPEAIATMILPQDQPGSFDIVDLKIDHPSGKFTAAVVAPSVNNPIQTNAISGNFYTIVQVPVLRSALRNGTIIGQRDIDTISMRADTISNDVILDPQQMIGMTPRKISASRKPLTDNDLEAPQVVSRGDPITIVLKSGPMVLTALGKALENGAKGDLIRVTSAEGNKTLQAEVIGEKEVQISDF
jgi:flagella basal body P-ring formation protein FlgA